MLKNASVIFVIIVLIIYFFTNNTISLFETYDEYKNGTNRILNYHTKLGITLDLQEQMRWDKKQLLQNEQWFHFDVGANTVLHIPFEEKKNHI